MDRIVKIRERKVKVIYIIFYKFIYEIAYIYFVSPTYSYMNLTFTPNWSKYALSLIITILCVQFLPTNQNNASTYLLVSYFIFSIIPILGIYWMKDQPTLYLLMCISSFGILVLTATIKIKKRYINFGKALDPFVLLLVLVFIGIGLLTYKYGVAKFTALNLSDVYEVRGLRSYSGVFAYLVNWLPKVIIPSLMVISLYKKRFAYYFVAVSAQIYMFLFTGAKTTLFSILLITISYIFISLNPSMFIERWSIFLIISVIGSSILAWYFKSITLMSIVCMRLSAIPASISFNHYNFFSTNPKLIFAENFIGKMFGIVSPYPEFSTMMLGGAGGNANTGYLGDAYDNGGFIVMIIYSIILGILVRFINSADNKYLSVTVPCFMYTIIMLNDTSLTVSMLTGGMFLIYLFVWYFIYYENKELYRSNVLCSKIRTQTQTHK